MRKWNTLDKERVENGRTANQTGTDGILYHDAPSHFWC